MSKRSSDTADVWLEQSIAEFIRQPQVKERAMLLMSDNDSSHETVRRAIAGWIEMCGLAIGDHDRDTSQYLQGLAAGMAHYSASRITRPRVVH